MESRNSKCLLFLLGYSQLNSCETLKNLLPISLSRFLRQVLFHALVIFFFGNVVLTGISVSAIARHWLPKEVFVRLNSRFLLGTNREDEARKAITDVNGVPVDDHLVQEVTGELALGIKEEKKGDHHDALALYSLIMHLYRVASRLGPNTSPIVMCSGDVPSME
jgi:hypothetical protein